MQANNLTVKFTVTLDLTDVSADTADAIRDVLRGELEFQYGDEWLNFEEVLADWLPDVLPEGVTVLSASVKLDKGGLKLPKIDLPDIGLGGGAAESIAPSGPIIQSNVASSVSERPGAYGASPKISPRPRTSRRQPRQRLTWRRRTSR